MPVSSGLTPKEQGRVKGLRERLMSNKRRDPKGNIRGSRQITPREHSRIGSLRSKLSKSPGQPNKPKPNKPGGKPDKKKSIPRGNWTRKSGLTKNESSRVRALRRRLVGNDRKDKPGQVQGSRRITPAEYQRIQKLRNKLRRDTDIPPISQFLSGDLTYKGQISDFKRNQENYNTDYRTNREDVQRIFGDTTSRMERERDRAMEQMRSDFASRGLIHSGLFADQTADYNTEFAIKGQELAQDRSEQLRDLLRNKQLFAEETRGNRRSARDEAIRRRAQRYTLG